MNRLALPAALLAALLLAGCHAGDGDSDDAASSAAPATPVAPVGNDDMAWKTYLSEVINLHTDGITERTFPYYLPAGVDPSVPEGEYFRLQNLVRDAVLRGVLPGNMLAFGSPDSSRMADLIVEAFSAEGVKDTALRGSRVLFIGQAKDESRVRQAVLASGAEFRFVEAK